MPYGFIKDLSVPTITHNTDRQWFGETKNGLLQYAKRFQKEKIQIMVKTTYLGLARGFTGAIKMNSEEDWKILEASYSQFILTYARAAEELNVAIFCIGTELEEFVASRPAYWQKLIQEIREVYKGKLTYAANWDEFKRVVFWKDLDFIGIDAYFPLSAKKSPTIAEYELGWKGHKAAILKVQKQFKNQLFLQNLAIEA